MNIKKIEFTIIKFNLNQTVLLCKIVFQRFEDFIFWILKKLNSFLALYTVYMIYLHIDYLLWGRESLGILSWHLKGVHRKQGLPFGCRNFKRHSQHSFAGQLWYYKNAKISKVARKNSSGNVRCQLSSFWHSSRRKKNFFIIFIFIFFE